MPGLAKAKPTPRRKEIKTVVLPEKNDMGPYFSKEAIAEREEKRKETAAAFHDWEKDIRREPIRKDPFSHPFFSEKPKPLQPFEDPFQGEWGFSAKKKAETNKRLKEKFGDNIRI